MVSKDINMMTFRSYPISKSSLFQLNDVKLASCIHVVKSFEVILICFLEWSFLNYSDNEATKSTFSYGKFSSCMTIVC